MKSTKGRIFLIFVFCIALVSSCKSDWEVVDDARPTTGAFEKYSAESPINIKAAHKFYSNVAYGGHERNVLDIWVAEGKTVKGPLVIYIHGGGFQNGDKKSAYNHPSKFGIGPDQINRFLDEGFSFATINYRLLEKSDRDGVLKCLEDSKRAVQFLRYHSEELKINAERIGLAGSSAGGGAALWIGFQDDMAIEDSEDPIARQSTRVQALAVQETQSTYDIMRWSSDVFPEGIFSLDKIRGTGLANRLMVFYGVKDFNELESDDLVAYRNKVDMLAMINKGDPPVYILNKKDFKPEKGNLVGNLLHSPYHAVALKRELEKAGVKREIYIPAEGSKPKTSQTVAGFLIENLKTQ